jgi:hypothetical protein
MGRPSEFFCRTPCSKITAAAHRPYTLANTHCYTFVSQSHVMVANVDITFPCHCKFSFGMKTRARVRRRPLLSKSIQLPCTVKLLKHSSVYSILAHNTPKVVGRHPPRDRGPSLRACVGPRCQACRAMTGGRRMSGRYHLDLDAFEHRAMPRLPWLSVPRPWPAVPRAFSAASRLPYCSSRWPSGCWEDRSCTRCRPLASWRHASS